MATGVRGLHAPLVTPFDEARAVDLAALDRLAEEVLDAGSPRPMCACRWPVRPQPRWRALAASERAGVAARPRH
jgi:hypothetical protein